MPVLPSTLQTKGQVFTPAPLNNFTGKYLFLNSDSIGTGAHSNPELANWTDQSNYGTTGWWGQFLALTGAGGQNYSISNKTVVNADHCAGPHFLESEIPNKPGDGLYYFIQLGTNDNAYNKDPFTVANYKSVLIAALDNAVANKGWAYADFVLITAWWSTLDGMNYSIGGPASCSGVTVGATYGRLESYVAAVKEIALLKHTCFVDMYTPTKGRVDLMNPYSSIHPLYAGHQLQATILSRTKLTPL